MFSFISRAALVWATALCALPAYCQLTPTPVPTQRPGTSPAEPAQAPTLRYASTFDSYRPFGDAALVPWRQANEDVHKAGGWRAYAKEAQAPSAPPSPALPVPPARPAQTASGAKP